ncbi:hypothetical protein C3B79_4003 [Aeromonas hydrophila]|nr:hypothetical protein C3B79_4003 [Aeromonas hydrophila]
MRFILESCVTKKQRSQIIDLNQIYIYHQLVMVLLKNN